MHLILSDTNRRATRRAVLSPCIAVATDGYRLIGQQLCDLSPRGILVVGQTNVELGENVFISFCPPGDGKWLNVEAEVTRIVQGNRTWDPGPCVGMRFKNTKSSLRGELLARLAGIPPTIPRRPLRFSSSSSERLCTPAIPLTERRYPVPLGVFRAIKKRSTVLGIPTII